MELALMHPYVEPVSTISFPLFGWFRLAETFSAIWKSAYIWWKCHAIYANVQDVGPVISMYTMAI